MEPLARELLWLRRVRDLAQDLVEETSLSVLLPRILEAAQEITEAERGYLVRVEGRDESGEHRCKVECAIGWTKTQLRGALGDVSRTVVERVLESGEGLVTTREHDADVLDASSVQRRQVVSIICVPMRLRGEVRGILYLDHRFREGVFTEADLPVLRTFADQAALALETAELRVDASRRSEGLAELELMRSASGSPAPSFGRLVGNSRPMQLLYEQIERAARGWDPVLVVGESGTGKELVARELHTRGSSPGQPFLVQVCAAVSDAQLEGELFGTRSQGAQAGSLVRAERGTLVLDDVADLSPTLQAKMVGVLRDQSLIPVGATHRAPVDCRVVAITQHDLLARVREGTFREDLYYRLDVQRLEVPPLRDRDGDVRLLLDHYAEESIGRPLTYTEHAAELLARHAWPGNVRELRNEVKRLIEADVETISARQLSEQVRGGKGMSQGEFAGKTLGEVEKAMIESALKEAKGNKARAARQLGIPRSTLYGLMERYGLS